MLQPSLTVDEFEPDDPLAEISRKLANVAITNNLRLGEDGTVDRDLLPVIKDCLQTREPTHPDTYEAVRLLRKYLTQAGSTNVNIQDILDLDVLNELKHLLTLYDLDETQFECTWIITNIGAGESRHTHTLVEAGFIPLLIECLKSPDCAPCVKAQAAWALSNIAGDSPELREILMQHGALVAVSQVLNQVFDAAIGTEPQWRSNRQLIQLYEDNEVKTDVKALVWTISNMTRGGFRTADYWESYIPAFEVLVKCTLFDHKELWADTAWGLSRIMYNIHKVDAFFSKVNVPSDFGERLVILLNSSKESVQGPALRFLVNLTSGPDEHSYALVDRHLIRALADVMDPDVNAPLRRDACLTVANLAAIPGHLSEGVLNDGGILRGLVENLRVPFYQYVKPEGRWRQCDWRASDQEEVEEEWKIVHECLWAVANLLEAAPNEGVRMLCHQEYHRIPLHLGRLAVYDAKLIPVNVCSKLVDAMNDLMDRNSALIGYKRCEYMEDWESLQVVDAIEQMAFVHSEAKELQERCQRLLSRLILTGDKHNKNNSNTLDIDNVAAMFGFAATNDATRKPQKRRILHGLEDGDVRLIENAVGKLSI